jgi:mono/diheme cytochrome c family protein
VAGSPLPPVASPSNPALPIQSTADTNALVWDATLKSYQAKPGEATVPFTFWLTNISSTDILVNRASTSCGCTVAQLPSQPWRIPAGGDGPIRVTMSLVGKIGLISKGVTIETSVGIQQLTVRTEIPPGSTPTAMPLPAQASGTMNDGERLQNMQMALADRQVVFKNKDCAKCHAEPAVGKHEGRELYAAVCATCHNSHLRAAMVPDLRTLKHPTDADFWRKWITYGRAGSMMPAFATAEGGPLEPYQVDALVAFMVRAFPNRPAPVQAAPASPGSPAANARPTAQLSPAGPGVPPGPGSNP